MIRCGLTALLFVVFQHHAAGQPKEPRVMVVERQKPAEWNDLVPGARFMDLFLPMPDLGGVSAAAWGAANVIPRDTNNGIEAPNWSYWGGNTLLGKDGKYHLFVCRWPESSQKGHMAYHDSQVVHALADTPYGPFKVLEEIGHGHNPTCYETQSGQYILYVIDKYYQAGNMSGPWEQHTFEFDKRDRKTSKQHNFLHNCTFAKREDGSFLMVNRHGHTWLSKDGLDSWNMVGQGSVYPPVEGKYEDPVVWKDHVQYHLIVNDWLGRMAWYMRSKDGVNWKTEPGEAYIPGISRHTAGFRENWHKYERMRIVQDRYGRAIAANFAVIDTLKYEDLPNDNHSSKLIVVPLNTGRLLTISSPYKMTAKTKTIELRVAAEAGFDPCKDLDLGTLRFGASEEVNFGRGCQLIDSRESGKDLILVFDASGHGFADGSFAGKLLGKTNDGQLLFGYARLPWVSYIEPMLSSRAPRFTKSKNGYNIQVEVQNFGQVASKKSMINVLLLDNDKEVKLASGSVPELGPFEKTTIELSTGRSFKTATAYDIKTAILTPGTKPVEFTKNIEIQSPHLH